LTAIVVVVVMTGAVAVSSTSMGGTAGLLCLGDDGCDDGCEEGAEPDAEPLPVCAAPLTGGTGGGRRVAAIIAAVSGDAGALVADSTAAAFGARGTGGGAWCFAGWMIGTAGKEDAALLLMLPADEDDEDEDAEGGVFSTTLTGCAMGMGT
jgi:hypothetical protein